MSALPSAIFDASKLDGDGLAHGPLKFFGMIFVIYL